MSSNAHLVKEIASFGTGVDTRSRVDIPINAAPRWECQKCHECTDINKVLCRWCKKDGRHRDTLASQRRLLIEYKSRKGDKKKPHDRAEADTDGFVASQRPAKRTKGSDSDAIAELKAKIADLETKTATKASTRTPPRLRLQQSPHPCLKSVRTTLLPKNFAKM